nr:hypothetical protein TgIa.1860 [Toxoplasma gondii RH]
MSRPSPVSAAGDAAPGLPSIAPSEGETQGDATGDSNEGRESGEEQLIGEDEENRSRDTRRIAGRESPEDTSEGEGEADCFDVSFYSLPLSLRPEPALASPSSLQRGGRHSSNRREEEERKEREERKRRAVNRLSTGELQVKRGRYGSSVGSDVTAAASSVATLVALPSSSSRLLRAAHADPDLCWEWRDTTQEEGDFPVSREKQSSDLCDGNSGVFFIPAERSEGHKWGRAETPQSLLSVGARCLASCCVPAASWTAPPGVYVQRKRRRAVSRIVLDDAVVYRHAAPVFASAAASVSSGASRQAQTRSALAERGGETAGNSLSARSESVGVAEPGGARRGDGGEVLASVCVKTTGVAFILGTEGSSVRGLEARVKKSYIDAVKNKVFDRSVRLGAC